MAFLYYNWLTDIYTPSAAVVPNKSQMAYRNNLLKNAEQVLK